MKKHIVTKIVHFFSLPLPKEKFWCVSNNTGLAIGKPDL